MRSKRLPPESHTEKHFRHPRSRPVRNFPRPRSSRRRAIPTQAPLRNPRNLLRTRMPPSPPAESYRQQKRRRSPHNPFPRGSLRTLPNALTKSTDSLFSLPKTTLPSAEPSRQDCFGATGTPPPKEAVLEAIPPAACSGSLSSPTEQAAEPLHPAACNKSRPDKKTPGRFSATGSDLRSTRAVIRRKSGSSSRIESFPNPYSPATVTLSSPSKILSAITVLTLAS